MRRFLFCVLLQAACAARAGGPSVARPPSIVDVVVTVDDLPSHGPSFTGIDRVAIADRMIATFRAHRLPPVVGFVNGQRADNATNVVLQRWLASGNRLGNHTWSHVSLNDASIDAFIREIERGGTFVDSLAPRSSKLFRFPFLFEGDTEAKRDSVRDYLAGSGITVARVTIDADDWAFNPPFARCMTKNDSKAIASLREMFVAAHGVELARMRQLTRTLAGHEVAQILLLHIGAADADALDSLLTAYENAGVRFVSLESALADPFYATEVKSTYRFGAALPYLIAKERHVKAPVEPPPARHQQSRLDAFCR